MKKSKIYVYEYPYKKQDLFEKLNNRKGLYHNYGQGKYLITIKNECEFWLGVERGGHSGYWYIANLEERDNKIIVSGKIIYDPDEEGKEKSKTFGDIVGLIIFSPLLLILNFIDIIVFLFNKIIKPKEKHLTTSDKLDNFMLNYLNCKKI